MTTPDHTIKPEVDAIFQGVNQALEVRLAFVKHHAEIGRLKAAVVKLREALEALIDDYADHLQLNDHYEGAPSAFIAARAVIKGETP